MLDKYLTGGVIFMSFTYEQKVQAVKLVKEEHLSYLRAGRAIGASKVTVLGWVKLVEHHGYEALHQRTHTTYSGDFKLEVVNYMHDNHLSCHMAAAYFNLSKTQVQRWERIYYEEGKDALLIESRGRTKTGMPQKRKQTIPSQEQEDLIAEVQRLRMENEYLKKLNALVQKRIKREERNKSKPSGN